MTNKLTSLPSKTKATIQLGSAFVYGEIKEIIEHGSSPESLVEIRVNDGVTNDKTLILPMGKTERLFWFEDMPFDHMRYNKAIEGALKAKITDKSVQIILKAIPDPDGNTMGIGALFIQPNHNSQYISLNLEIPHLSEKSKQSEHTLSRFAALAIASDMPAGTSVHISALVSEISSLGHLEFYPSFETDKAILTQHLTECEYSEINPDLKIELENLTHLAMLSLPDEDDVCVRKDASHLAVGLPETIETKYCLELSEDQYDALMNWPENTMMEKLLEIEGFRNQGISNMKRPVMSFKLIGTHGAETLDSILTIVKAHLNMAFIRQSRD